MSVQNISFKVSGVVLQSLIFYLKSNCTKSIYLAFTIVSTNYNKQKAKCSLHKEHVRTLHNLASVKKYLKHKYNFTSSCYESVIALNLIFKRLKKPLNLKRKTDCTICCKCFFVTDTFAFSQIIANVHSVYFTTIDLIILVYLICWSF